MCICLFLAQNGEGTAWERSRNSKNNNGHDERKARNGTGTVQERKNYCNGLVDIELLVYYTRSMKLNVNI